MDTTAPQVNEEDKPWVCSDRVRRNKPRDESLSLAGVGAHTCARDCW